MTRAAMHLINPSRPRLTCTVVPGTGTIALARHRKLCLYSTSRKVRGPIDAMTKNDKRGNNSEEYDVPGVLGWLTS